MPPQHPPPSPLGTAKAHSPLECVTVVPVHCVGLLGGGPRVLPMPPEQASISSALLQKDILMHRWRYPSLSLHGIEGAFSGSGAKTVIPRKVVGKFSIRLVPNMTPEVVSEQVRGDAGREWGQLRAVVTVNLHSENFHRGGSPLLTLAPQHLL